MLKTMALMYIGGVASRQRSIHLRHPIVVIPSGQAESVDGRKWIRRTDGRPVQMATGGARRPRVSPTLTATIDRREPVEQNTAVCVRFRSRYSRPASYIHQHTPYPEDGPAIPTVPNLILAKSGCTSHASISKYAYFAVAKCPQKSPSPPPTPKISPTRLSGRGSIPGCLSAPFIR